MARTKKAKTTKAVDVKKSANEVATGGTKRVAKVVPAPADKSVPENMKTGEDTNNNKRATAAAAKVRGKAALKAAEPGAKRKPSESEEPDSPEPVPKKTKKSAAASASTTAGTTSNVMKTVAAKVSSRSKQLTTSTHPGTSEAASTSAGAASNVTKTVTAKVSSRSKNLTTSISPVYPSNAGHVLVTGEGDTGQLGLGPDIMDRSKPGRVDLPPDVVQVCAGGMHSVCLTKKGEVLTFGCNDEGALGRRVADEEECMLPEKVELPEKIVLVSAGDSHTAALSASGRLFAWGTFRDINGPIGIIPGTDKLEAPTPIMTEYHIVKIASGSNHLVFLTKDGDIYSLGAAEQGQLGRVSGQFTERGGRRGLKYLLDPGLVKCRARKTKFSDIWTGQYCTYAKAAGTGDIYAWGLNNYYQLGIPDMENKFVPEKSESFHPDKNWVMISGGQHHALGLDSTGLVYALGRKEYGRLGLGEEGLDEKKEPTLIPSLQNKKCICVNCGTAVSFAVTANGAAYGWGMGSTMQLGQGDDDSDVYEPVVIAGKQLENKKVVMVSSGGQHTMILATDGS